ncbi:MAG TPA: hypothetical protein P5206_07330 [Paludibacteraceae bacterium]|nr:hypothetical protein [Paludibacteraceae bacterium]
MRNLSFVVVACLLVVNAFAEISVTKLWERSVAEGNVAANLQVGISTSQCAIAVSNDTIFLADNNPAMIYCYSIANGDYLTAFTAAAGNNFVQADAAGHIVTFGPEGASYLNMWQRGTALDSVVQFGATYKEALPAVYGDLATTGYVFTFVSTQKQIRRYTVNNFKITACTTISITDLAATYVSGRTTCVMPINKDEVVINIDKGYSTLVDMRHGDYTTAQLNRFITKNVPVADAVFPTQCGGTVFMYKNRTYLVQGWGLSVNTDVYGGSFKIYDITDLNNVTVVFQRDDVLGGNNAATYEILHFQAVEKPDGVYIYEYALLNGMAAYKLSDTSTAVDDAIFGAKNVFCAEGRLHITATEAGNVEVFSLMGQKLLSEPVAVGNNELMLANGSPQVLLVRINEKLYKVAQ